MFNFVSLQTDNNIKMKNVLKPVSSSHGRKVSDSPFDPARMKEVAVAKLKVKTIQLTMEIEAAVASSDFLKAHEIKQVILKIEEEIQVIENGKIDTGKMDEVNSEKTSAVKTPTTAVKTPTTAIVVATAPSGSKHSPTALKKLTNGQVGKKESTKKKEAMLFERKANRDEMLKNNIEEKFKERKKEIDKRFKEVEKLEKGQNKKVNYLKEKENRKKEVY